MTLEQLYVAAGSDVNEVLQRLPNTQFIEKMLLKFMNDPSKESLDQAVTAMDPAEAFRAVHTLKGVALSLGLAELAEPCKALAEDLRPGDFGEGWKENYKELCRAYTHIISCIAELEQ